MVTSGILKNRIDKANVIEVHKKYPCLKNIPYKEYLEKSVHIHLELEALNLIWSFPSTVKISNSLIHLILRHICLQKSLLLQINKQELL